MKIAKIDLDDAERCKKYKWFVNNSNIQKFDYFYVGTFDENKKYLALHRFVMNASKDEDIDHHNRNPLDNRKANLRSCNDSKNAMNTKLKDTNKSGHKGICWNKKTNSWMAYIMINYKHKTLGYFNNLDDAIKCREKAEDKYFGEFKAVI